MYETVEQFFSRCSADVAGFNAWAERMQPTAKADHLCYKCGSREEFVALRALLEPWAPFFYQSMIAGRPIAFVKLAVPIETPLGEIWFLELSDQKPDGSQSSGFDHIEIYPTSGTMEELAHSLEAAGQAFEKVVRPHHTTYDAVIHQTFKVRLEDEPLIAKIMRDEMR